MGGMVEDCPRGSVQIAQGQQQEQLHKRNQWCSRDNNRNKWWYEENRSIGFKKLCQGWAVVPTKRRGVGGSRILGHGDRLRIHLALWSPLPHCPVDPSSPVAPNCPIDPSSPAWSLLLYDPCCPIALLDPCCPMITIVPGSLALILHYRDLLPYDLHCIYCPYTGIYYH